MNWCDLIPIWRQVYDNDPWEPSSWAALLLPLEKVLLLVLARFSTTIDAKQEPINALKAELDRAFALAMLNTGGAPRQSEEGSAELRATHKSLCMCAPI